MKNKLKFQMSNNKSLVIDGPTILDIYINKEGKKIMFIGDTHYINNENNGVSLNKFFKMINTEDPIGFVTEGNETVTYKNSPHMDSYMMRVFNSDVIKKDYKLLWGDYRHFVDLTLVRKDAILLFQIGQGFYKWNNSTDKNTLKNLREEMLNRMKNFFSSYRKIRSINGNELIKHTIKQFPKYIKVFNKLSIKDQNIVKKYIFKNIFKGGDINDFFIQYDNINNKIISILKSLFLSVNNYTNIEVKDFNIISKFQYILRNIIDTIFESYMLALILCTDYNRYIIHAGGTHIGRLEKWFSEKLNYRLYFSAKKITEQSVNIKGLNFI